MGFPGFPLGRCGVDARSGNGAVVYKALGRAVNEGFQLAVHVDENLVGVVEGAVGDGAAGGSFIVAVCFAVVDGGAEGDGGAVFPVSDLRVVVRAAPREGCQHGRQRYRRGKPQADAVPPDGFREGMVLYLHVLFIFLFFYFLFLMNGGHGYYLRRSWGRWPSVTS